MSNILTAALHLALSVSRFRFWIYTGGTYVVGYALGMNDWTAFLRPEYTLFLVYFFFPANVFLYGINDFWDGETDRHNPKKQGREHLLSEDERKLLIAVLVVAVVPVPCLFFCVPLPLQLALLGFLALAYGYSAPPFRFKEIPVLDFSSNVLYIMPGIFGYLLASGTLPPIELVSVGFLHIAAMHLFSAIPDIGCDREAGIRTTAVVLGKSLSLALCCLFWGCMAVIIIRLSGMHPAAFISLGYSAIPLLLLVSGLSIERLYWFLPYFNTCCGGLVFLLATAAKAAGPLF
ncbi:MAG: prenyltransferase [Methanoculleus sp. SDB]|nr:MAG: prenyltransferase [Methanoculleus sp. SDB]